ncbi:hypothetical protein I546_4885 [Mycobacterium kansasii 732]|nr:hypothetical protein I546_4885 [Mycobacterium kansasii 732]
MRPPSSTAWLESSWLQAASMASMASPYLLGAVITLCLNVNRAPTWRQTS